MAAIFRVKRRNDDEPLDALVVSCKKRKTESEEAVTSTALSAIVRFAGTVKDQDENVFKHITKKLSKEELKTNFKQHIVDVTSKVRKETKEASAENRFKVINYFRSLDKSKTDDSDVEEITVIDVEDTRYSCSVKERDSENKDDYVYDIYYTDEQSEDFFTDNFDGIQTLVFDPYREKGVINCDDDGESENSNSESYWKNDYPDSEYSEDSISEEQMREAVNKLNIYGEKSDLSSEDDNFCYGVDEKDVDYFGSDYAKYKAKLKKEWGNDDSNSSRDKSSESEGIGDLDD